jgi:hypothetical protein
MAVRPLPRYTDAIGAAIYMGYSTSRFRELAKEFYIPRYGQANNRFKLSDLDMFMENPYCFAKKTLYIKERQTFTPLV